MKEAKGKLIYIERGRTRMMTWEELQNYKGVPEKPEDFDSYWDTAVEQSRADGDVYTLERAESPEEGTDCWYLTFQGLDNAHIFCKLARPSFIHAPGPAACLFQGYFGTRPDRSAKENFDRILPYTRQGITVLVMGTRGQCMESEDPLKETQFHFPHLYLKDVLSDNAEHSYCRGIFTDAAKCARILIGMKDVDKQCVSAFGFSQGADLTIACAALEPRVNRIIFGGAGIVDCARYVREMDYIYYDAALGNSLRQYFAECDPEHKTENKIIRRMSYNDGLLFANRIRASVINTIGRQDRVCHASGQLALYNRLTVPKKLVLWQEGGHALPPGFVETLPSQLIDDNFPN